MLEKIGRECAKGEAARKILPIGNKVTFGTETKPKYYRSVTSREMLCQNIERHYTGFKA
jgi:hypothetical protein